MKLVVVLACVFIAAGCIDQTHGGEAAAGTAADAPAAIQPGFPAYWSEFRRAILEEDREMVASLSRFPFEVRGALDSDPAQSLDQAAFLKRLDRLLEQDSGIRAEPTSMRHLIEATDSASEDVVGASGASARIGSFVFERTPGGWRFVAAYVEE